MKNKYWFGAYVFLILVLSIAFISGCGSQAPSSDGGGGGGSSAPKGILYVGCVGGNCIKIFDNINSTSTDEITAESRVISGDATKINVPDAISLFIDTVHDDLYLGNNSNSILVFAKASTLNGNITPEREIKGASTTISSPRGIAVDTAHNCIYLADTSSGSILVFNRTDTGNVAPTRTISGMNLPYGVYLDQTHDRLYVSDTGMGSIEVFNSASTANGLTTPSRTITRETYVVSPKGIYVDTGKDMLVAADSSGSDWYLWYNASTITGRVTPDSFLQGGSSSQISSAWALTVDTVNGVIFNINSVNSGDQQRVGMWRGKMNGGAFLGDIAPDRIISGDAADQNSGTTSLAIDESR